MNDFAEYGIEVRKTEPLDLPSELIYTLNVSYHVELKNYVVAFDSKNFVLHVNPNVPDDDIVLFLKYITFYGIAVNEEPYADYIYDKHGSGAYSVLFGLIMCAEKN